MTVLLRALGPLLDGVVADPLQDPTLPLSDGSGNIIASNDSWRGPQEQDLIDSSFAPPSDLEPALIATLAAGSYAATVRGVNNTTGTALNELFDSTPTGGTAFVASFGARGRVESGAGALATTVEFRAEQGLFVAS